MAADDKADFEVELVDDVSRPAKKAQGALARLRKTFGQFNSFRNTLGLGQGIKDTLGVVRKLGSGAGSGIGALATAAGHLKPAFIAAAAPAAALVAGVAAMTVSMVDFGQRSRQAFSLLAKEGEVPEQLFQRSIALAQQLGLDVKDTTKQVQKFRALQFTQDQGEALIKMGADMQALGASGEEVSRVFAQLGQIKAKNRLQSEELTTLAESGVSTQVVYAALAKQLGKTEKAVKDLVSEGKITGSQALNAIGTAILFKTGTKEFGEAGKQMAESTLSGMAGVLKAKGQAMFLGIADSAGGEINDTAKALFRELSGFMDSGTGKNFTKGIANAVALLATTVREAIPFVKQFLSGFSEGASSAFSEVAGAFKMFIEPFTGGDGKAGIAIMKSLGQTLGALTVLLGGAALAFGGLATGVVLAMNMVAGVFRGQFEVFTNTIGMIISAVTDFWANLKAIWNAEGMSLGQKAFEIGSQIIQGLVNGMVSLAMLPITTMTAIANRSVDAAKGVFQQHSPSKVFEDIGKNNVLGLNKGHEKLPTQSVISDTLGNDNGTPVRGNLSGRAPSGAAGSGGRSGASIGPITITIQMAAGATPQDARAAGEAAADGFYSRVHEYFDDMLLEEAV